jgi:glyoxylase-like metal-dependent hydrolase (beta-lactamase superfamily II)
VRRPFVVTLVLALVGCMARGQSPSPPPAPVAAPAGFVLRDVARGALVLTEPEPWQANLLLVEMPERSLLLVNAPATEASTRALLDWIDVRFGSRRLVVVNTHFHLDACGGNAVLLEAGAEVIGSRDTAALIVARGRTMRESITSEYATTHPAFAAGIAETRVVPPARLFDPRVGLVLDFGGERVRVVHPGPAHSPDNVVVFFPDRGLLFGGCMVKGGPSLGNLGDADVARWPEAIRILQGLRPTIVVPGHESRLDPAQLDHTLALLAVSHRGDW